MWIDLFNTFRKAFKPVNAEDERIVKATLLEFVQDSQPELGTLFLLASNPHPQHFFESLEVDGNGEVNRLRPHHALDSEFDEAAQARKVLV